MFHSFVRNHFNGVSRTLLFVAVLFISPLSFHGPHFVNAAELQSVQFSQVQPYNATLTCSARSNFSQPIRQKIPDLSKVVNYNPENILQFNLTGIWALYYGVNYTGTCVISEVTTCLAESTDRSLYKSMRFLGNPDADFPGLSLFPGDGGIALPHGTETFINQTQFNFPRSQPMCVAFWASTGNSSWTIFSERDFKGESVCLKGLSYQKNSRGPLDYVLVGSVRHGCSQSNNLKLENNELSSSNNMRLASCRASWSTPSPSPSPTTTGTGAENCRLSILTMFLTCLSLIFLRQK